MKGGIFKGRMYVSWSIEGSAGVEESRRVVQRRFYDEDCDPEFEIVRPRELRATIPFLIERKFETGSGGAGAGAGGQDPS